MATKKDREPASKRIGIAKKKKSVSPSKAAATKTPAKRAAKVAQKAAPARTPKAPKAAREAPADEPGVTIDVGQRAPSFVLKDAHGNLVSSESLRGSAYVIYFYPKDDTPGCTLEACAFRDSAPRFEAKGVKILGVSPDSPEAHARFQSKYGLNFTLLSDPEKTLSKAYGVWTKKQNYGREYMGVQRSTFYVDRRGVIQKVWRGVRVPGHVDAVVHAV